LNKWNIVVCAAGGAEGIHSSSLKMRKHGHCEGEEGSIGRIREIGCDVGLSAENSPGADMANVEQGWLARAELSQPASESRTRGESSREAGEKGNF
jgi:hypothetical protein